MYAVRSEVGLHLFGGGGVVGNGRRFDVGRVHHVILYVGLVMRRRREHVGRPPGRGRARALGARRRSSARGRAHFAGAGAAAYVLNLLVTYGQGPAGLTVAAARVEILHGLSLSSPVAGPTAGPTASAALLRSIAFSLLIRRTLKTKKKRF